MPAPLLIGSTWPQAMKAAAMSDRKHTSCEHAANRKLRGWIAGGWVVGLVNLGLVDIQGALCDVCYGCSPASMTPKAALPPSAQGRRSHCEGWEAVR